MQKLGELLTAAIEKPTAAAAATTAPANAGAENDSEADERPEPAEPTTTGPDGDAAKADGGEEHVTVEMMELAESTARAAHDGQVDKAQRPYEEHLARVAGRVEGTLRKTVAWLHDTLEDTGLTADDLQKAGFPENVVADVETLTRQSLEKYQGYIVRVGEHGSETAIAVKLADLDDHLDNDDGILSADHRRRYRHAAKTLKRSAKRRGIPTPARG